MKNFTHLFIGLLLTSLVSHAQQGLTDLGYPQDAPTGSFFIKNDMIMDDQQTIWIACGTPATMPEMGGLFAFRNGDWTYYLANNSDLPANRVTSLTADQNMVAATTFNGIAFYNIEEDYFLVMNDTFFSDTVLSYTKTTVQDMHVSFWGSIRGLHSEYPDWITYNTFNSGIAGDTVSALLGDVENKLWVGTSNGLCLFDVQEDEWTFIEGTENLHIRTLQLDLQGNLWIGTVGNGGLFCYKEGELLDFETLTHIVPDDDYMVKSIAVTDEGDVYAAIKADSMYSLIRFSGDRFYLYDISLKEPVLLYAEGELYMSSDNLYHFNPDQARLWDSFDFIEINNIRTRISSSGQLSLTQFPSRNIYYEYPANSGKHTIFSQSLVVGGLSEDTDNEHLHINPVIGYQNWYTGPLSADEDAYLQTQEKWNRVWPMSRQMVEEHLANWNQPGYQVPDAISEWPAHGDPQLGQQADIAPFYDVNDNGVYEPDQGDYPIIRGDYALFFVINDQRYAHDNASHLGTEVRGMLYCYHAPEQPALHNSLFLNYQILNLSETDYHDMRIGLFSNFDIGDPYDDYAGADTMLHAIYMYNSQAVDGAGNPEYPGETYGEHPPAQAATFLNRPLSTAMYRNAHAVEPGDYSYPEQFWFNMQAKWQDGTPMSYGGTGYPVNPEDTIRAYHMYPGDLHDPDGWHELALENPLFGSRSMTSSSYVGDFKVNERLCFDLALVSARDMDGDHISSVDLMKAYLQDVHAFFADNLPSNCEDFLPTSLTEQAPQGTNVLHCYPNPANESFTIAYHPVSRQAVVHLYTLTGSFVKSRPVKSAHTVVSLQDMPSGIYLLKLTDGQRILHQKIVKR